MYAALICLFLFFMFLILNDLFAWVISDFTNNTVASVQGKPTDISNMPKVISGGVYCYILLTILMYFTLSLNYTSTFFLGFCVFGFHQGNNYATFDQWPVSMVVLDTLWGGVYFVLVKGAYRGLEYLFSKRTTNKPQNVANANKNRNV